MVVKNNSKTKPRFTQKSDFYKPKKSYLMLLLLISNILKGSQITMLDQQKKTRKIHWNKQLGYCF